MAEYAIITSEQFNRSLMIDLISSIFFLCLAYVLFAYDLSIMQLLIPFAVLIVFLFFGESRLTGLSRQQRKDLHWAMPGQDWMVVVAMVVAMAAVGLSEIFEIRGGAAILVAFGVVGIIRYLIAKSNAAVILAKVNSNDR